MKLIRGGDKKKALRRKCDNIVDELKDFLNEHINRMCVTDDVEELMNMRKWSNYCVEKICDFNYKRLNKNA